MPNAQCTMRNRFGAHGRSFGGSSASRSSA
jgi:hypothetical protein